MTYHSGLVRKAKAYHPGLVARAAKPTHPAGTVTAFDHASGLPIVKRHVPQDAPPAPQATTPAQQAAQATAAHPAMQESMAQATNKPQPVGQKESETGRDILQPTDNPAGAQALATQAMPEFVAKLKELVSKIPGAELVASRPAKNPERLAEKITGEDQPAETVSDYGAVQVAVDSPDARDAVQTAVKQAFPVVREKDNFQDGDEDYHYRSLSMQVQVPNGASIEFQIVPKEVFEANPDEHGNYKTAREAKLQGNDEAFQAQASEARQKNDAAMDAFNARNEVGKPETKTEGGSGESPERAVAGGAESSATEPKYKFGNTQANLPPDSDAARAIKSVQDTIPNEHLGGDGKDVDDPHVTVRYGVKGDDLNGLREFIKKQKPFTAKLGKTAAFPPSEHSDGASPVHATVESPELHRLNAEIEKHGDFAPSNFPSYKPHATIAYVKPEHAQKYVGSNATEGKTFKVDHISISDRNGNKEHVPMLGGSLQKGDEVRLKDGRRATVAYVPPEGAPIAVYRLKINGGQPITLKAKDVERGAVQKIGQDGKWVGVDLDGTTAKYTTFKGPTVIGAPIPAMIQLIKKMLADGVDVRFFTARVANDPGNVARKAIEEYSQRHIGEKLPVTNVKDRNMVALIDDRAIQAERNTGKLLGDPEAAMKE